jgi:hypothetical protein
MRMRSLIMTSALIATAVPLCAVAGPAAANDLSAANVEQAAPAPENCPAGWIWEPAGYMGNGHWRPAHCAPRNDIIP